MSKNFTSLSCRGDEHLSDVCSGYTSCKCQPCSWLKSARNDLGTAGSSREICVLYVTNIAGPVPYTLERSGKKKLETRCRLVYLSDYLSAHQCSQQTFTTACKEQSVKVSTVSGNSLFLRQKPLVGESFFPCRLHWGFFVGLVWDVIWDFFTRWADRFLYSLSSACAVSRGCCSRLSVMCLLTLLPSVGFLTWLQGNGGYMVEELPGETCPEWSSGFTWASFLWTSPKPLYELLGFVLHLRGGINVSCRSSLSLPTPCLQTEWKHSKKPEQRPPRCCVCNARCRDIGSIPRFLDAAAPDTATCVWRQISTAREWGRRSFRHSSLPLLALGP